MKNFIKRTLIYLPTYYFVRSISPRLNLLRCLHAYCVSIVLEYWISWWRSGLCFGDLGVVVFVTTTIRSALFEYNVFEFAVFILLVVRDFGDAVGFLLCVASIVVRLLN
ncbi:hypothetical protein QVD17_41935 [Tagetes erecta]|uniref:Uncharacterized protein n=1 Tax=Tagetes erecta TaxID=13708 RepID=A0AAD8NF52_TARER|nr:hypothetical protein QVD17_41935 [Tagetes erecta]